MFNEIIYKRSDEIILKDETYIKMASKILELEAELKNTLTPEQKIKYSQIENNVLESLIYYGGQMYMRGFKDKDTGFDVK